MSKQKRFTTRQQIVSEIDALRLTAQTKLSEAEILERDAKEYFKDSPGAWDGIRNLQEAKKLRKAVTRIEEVRLPKFGRMLAAFDTEPIPGVIADRAVVLEK